MDKSEMTFSPNIHQNVKNSFQEVLPFPITNNITKYLGMPTQIERSKQVVLNFIMERIRNKLKGWKEKHLSFAGRGILISAVIQALPTYTMSCFMLPKNMCEKIEKAICRFWWGSKEGQHKIHWKARSDLFKTKFEGGLGFRDMHLFNMAMLAKQVWRLQTDPDSLLGLCLKANIHQAIGIIKKGNFWKVGDGKSINIWEDNWVSLQNGYKILTPQNKDYNLSKVKDLIISHPIKCWNSSIIDQVFLPFE
ncbi:hypothetical protein A2U01_0018067, partial [Trifolium medium]|nr:hypothetical protein [Trifolium medium]